MVELPDLLDAAAVWINTEKPCQGTVATQHSSPKSYIVDSPTGKARRNRSQLKLLPPSTLPDGADGEQESNNQPERMQTRLQTGIAIRGLRIDWTYET